MAVPHIVPESNVKVFKFYANTTIHEAIFYDNKVMRLAGTFAISQKREAFDFAYNLCQEYLTLMTPGSSLYRVWVDIQCHQNFESIPPILSSQPS